MKIPLIYITLLFYGTLIGQVPRPNHVVITVFENRAYEYLKGNLVKAPFINSLLSDTNVALFTQSYALWNPSQANYLMLYSGSNQGVTTDTVPDGLPFTTCNLGANLLAKGFSIKSYCENLPSVGYTGNLFGKYLKRHNPVSYWQGTGQNNTPPEINRPFSDYPSDYNLLPDVSFVVGNVDHDMHNGSTQAGDKWFEDEFKSYLNWAKSNNSLLIFTFDEDDLTQNNHILTFFYGPMVKGGEYSTKIDHYNVLRTLEEMYGLVHCGNSATSKSIDYVWKNSPTGLSGSSLTSKLGIYPVPAGDELILTMSSTTTVNLNVIIRDKTARKISNINFDIVTGENSISIPIHELSPGIYFIEVFGDGLRETKKFVVN